MPRCQNDPTSTDASVNLGLVLERQGKCDEALECYGQALRLKPAVGQTLENVLGRLNFIAEARR